MIVAVNYQFHDHEPEMLVFNTELLTGNPFCDDLREALESKKSYILLNGADDYEDFNYPKASIITEFPVSIDAAKQVHVLFE
jgi:hypothetical protein